jgi:hypothetical protein
MEQKNLFDRYNYQQVGSSRNNTAATTGPNPMLVANNPASAPNRWIAQQLLKVHACPADNPPPKVTGTGAQAPYGAGPYERDDVRRSNYLFNIGNNIDQSNFWPARDARRRGPFGNNGGATLTTIRDGTSNTIAIGESKQKHGSSNYGPYWGAGLHTAVGGRISSVINPFLPKAVCFRPNHHYYNDPACRVPHTNQTLWPLQYAWGFGSWHPGITNFVMCDGAVKSLTDGIRPEVWMAYGTMEGGESWLTSSTNN